MDQQSIGLTERQWEAITLESNRLGVSKSEVVRRVLDMWLDENDFRFWGTPEEQAAS